MTSTMDDRPVETQPARTTAAHVRDLNGLHDRSTAELVRRAAEQLSTLVRDELKLAQLELATKGKRAGMGVGLFGAACVVALYGVAAFVTGAIIGLATVVPAWLAALLVGIALLVVAGIVALAGRSQVKKATPPIPSAAVRSVKADIDTVTE